MASLVAKKSVSFFSNVPDQPNEDEMILTFFEKYDDAKTGNLEKYHVLRMLKDSSLQKHLSIDEENLNILADILLKKIDSNNDGIIDKEDFFTGIKKLKNDSEKNITQQSTSDARLSILSDVSIASALTGESESKDSKDQMKSGAIELDVDSTVQTTSLSIEPLPTKKGKSQDKKSVTSKSKKKRNKKKMTTSLSPTSVDEIHDEDYEDPSEHKMGFFEKFKWKCARYWEFEGEKALVYFIIYFLNVAMYAIWWIRYYNITRYRNFSMVIPFAKGFTGTIYINTFLIFAVVCRGTLTWIREFFLTGSISSPVDKSIVIHRILGYLIVIGSTGHSLCHLFGSVPAITNVKSPDVLNKILLVGEHPFTHVPTYLELAFTTIPGLSGVILISLLYFMFFTSLQTVREKNFELFWYSHHLFIPFAVICYFHGMDHWLAWPEIGYFITPTFFLYLGERLLRFLRAKRKVTILKMAALEQEVSMIEMVKPSICHPRPGQYVFVCFPCVSRWQWHPFTLTSSPEEQVLRLHIKSCGDWTKEIHKLVKNVEEKEKISLNNDSLMTNTYPEIQIDGPFGAPSEHVFDFEHAVLIACGIGVTPFASVLRDIELKIKSNKNLCRLKSVDFHWINRTQKPSAWFHEILQDLRKDEIGRERFHINIYLTTNYSKDDIASVMLWTGLKLAEENLGYSLLTKLDENTFWGRPDFEILLKNVHQDCVKNKKDVGVFYCGPKGLSKRLYSICRRISRDTGHILSYQKENF